MHEMLKIWFECFVHVRGAFNETRMNTISKHVKIILFMEHEHISQLTDKTLERVHMLKRYGNSTNTNTNTSDAASSTTATSKCECKRIGIARKTLRVLYTFLTPSR